MARRLTRTRRLAKSQPVMPRKKPGKPAAAGGAARTRPAGSSASGTTPLVRLETAHPERMNNEQVARTTNRAFNQYLKITRRDRNLLRRHEKHLREGAKHFAETFYQYLFDHPATAQVLHNYKQQGEKSSG